MPGILIFLAGAKADFSAQQRQVKYESGQRFKTENDILYFAENSAKNGDNIQQLFINIARYLYIRR